MGCISGRGLKYLHVLALQVTNAVHTKQTVLDEESSSSESEKAQSSESGADHPLSGLFSLGAATCQLVFSEISEVLHSSLKLILVHCLLTDGNYYVMDVCEMQRRMPNQKEMALHQLRGKKPWRRNADSRP